MRYAHHTLRLFLLALMLGLGGCSTWLTGNYDDPEVHLKQVEVVKAKLLEQRFRLHFVIDNPNDEDLPIRGLSYKVSLEGLLLAEGEDDSWFSVRAHSRAIHVVDVRTNLWEHLKPLAKLLRHPDRPLQYRLEGELRTGVLFGHNLSLRRTGEITPAGLLSE
ncbi:LEA type 2 family protein [Pseudomonas sp. Marseille-Q5115]|uniref:LEA type 2 family protein n=1 Tax=Pseudomonas sp. Marseille-Q5115 TaxID=2866593 RepID=UPI001CE4111F|nr:LEA type 2 family protein [Pseudomonas sp. Marseille-Q5115]